MLRDRNACRPSMYARLRCRQAPQRELLDEWIGQQRLQLRKQHVALGRHELCLIEPADVDAVMDMYIAAGAESIQADFRL